MTAEYQDREAKIRTAADLVGVISERDGARDLAGQHLFELLEKVNAAQRALDADPCKSIEVVNSLLESSIIGNDPTVGAFAKTLLIHLAEGGKASDFFDQPQNKTWKTIPIGNLLNPDVAACLQELPTSSLPLLEMKKPEAKIEPIIKAKHITEIKSDKKPAGSIEEQDRNIKGLLENPTLWLKNSSDDKKYTSLGNLAVLLIGNTWKESELLLAKIALRQSIIPRWQRQDHSFASEPVGLRLKHSGRNLMLPLDQVIDLTRYMKENLGTKIRSPYRIVGEQIYNWPSISKKKVSRN